MGLALNLQQPYIENAHLIVTGLVQESLQILRNEENKDHTVHQVRKNFKKLRAVMRLLRPIAGDEEYRHYNRFYRDCSRELAPVRDSFVLVETLDMAANNERSELPKAGTAAFRQLLYENYEETRRVLLEEEDKIAEVTASLEEEPVVPLPILGRDDEAGMIAVGLEKVYKQGKERMEVAYKERTPEAFHEWRKSVKYLWHLIEIFTPVWPNLLMAYAESIHTLSDLLGKDHDYAVLMSEARETESVKEDFDFFKKLNGFIQQERLRLEDEAEKLGGKIYYELPEDFTDRLVFYYELAR